MNAKRKVLPLPDNQEIADAQENLRVAEDDLAEKAEFLVRLQAELDRERQRYQHLFQYAPDAYLLTDSHAVISEANEAAALLFNVSSAFLSSKVLTTFIAPEHHTNFWRNLRQLQKAALRMEWETHVLPRKRQPKEVHCTVVSAQDGSKQGTQLRWLIRDITPWKQIERERDLARNRALEHARQATIMAERSRMAQDLHDTLAQCFTGIRLQLELVDELFSTDPDEARIHLTRARQIAKQSIVDARQAIQALRAQDLENCDLPTALSRLCEQITRDTRTRAHFHVQGIPVELSGAVESDLFRIVQEAMTNAIRHAAAEQVTVSLLYSATNVQVWIRDNGQGFDVHAARHGFGLQGMHERAARLGTKLIVRSDVGKGAEIGIDISIAPPE